MLCKVIDIRFDRQQKIMDSCFDRWDKHVTSLEHDARQPRLTMMADGSTTTKTRKRTKGATTAVQTMHGDSCTTQKVQDGPKTSISSGVKAEPLALPCKDGRFDRGRRCRVQVVSPILGDALTISRRWLTPRRQNLHSNGDHLQGATFSVLRDRGDKSKGGKIMDFNSIRLLRQQLL